MHSGNYRLTLTMLRNQQGSGSSWESQSTRSLNKHPFHHEDLCKIEEEDCQSNHKLRTFDFEFSSSGGNFGGGADDELLDGKKNNSNHSRGSHSSRKQHHKNLHHSTPIKKKWSEPCDIPTLSGHCSSTAGLPLPAPCGDLIKVGSSSSQLGGSTSGVDDDAAAAAAASVSSATGSGQSRNSNSHVHAGVGSYSLASGSSRSSSSSMTCSSSLSTNSMHSSPTSSIASWPTSVATCSRRSAMKSSRSVSCSSISTKRSSTISFGSVSVHTHQVILGDNPSVQAGPPLALDWTPVKSERYQLDEFEQMNKEHHSKKPVRIPEGTREQWLVQNGHSINSCARASQEIDVIKAERDITRLNLDPMEEYHVLANVSFREERRQARLDAASSSHHHHHHKNAHKKSPRSFQFPWIRRTSFSS